MVVLVCMLFLVVLSSSAANGVVLEKPMSLLVMGEDLLSLENTVSLGSSMEDKVIKYGDELIFVAKEYLNAEKKKFLLVDGAMTLAKLNHISKPVGSLYGHREIRRLFFRNGCFYFEDSSSEPEPDSQDYLIVNYYPTKTQINVKPVIEYIPKHQLETELYNSIQKVRDQSMLTGAPIINTYFRMADGVKIYVKYDILSKVVAFKGYFRIIATDERNRYKKSVNLKMIYFDLLTKSFYDMSPLGEISGIRVTSISTSEKVKDLYLRITRKQLLKDILESSPSYEMRSSNVFGMISYDPYRMFTLKYIELNQKLVLRISGRFVTQDGVDLCCICVATPGDLRSDKSVVLSDETILYSCPPDSTLRIQILLQEKEDYIAIKPGHSVALFDSGRRTRDSKQLPTRFEPYLEYISHGQFLRALEVVSDVMKFKCASGYHRKSFRLFLNVFLVYDCNTGIVLFGPLDLWLSPDQETSSSKEYHQLSYYVQDQSLIVGDEHLSDFKLRQLHTNFPEKIPRQIMYQYENNYGNTDVVVDFRSLEWDLSNIRKDVFKITMPETFGVVCVDDDVLIRAEKSKIVVAGEKRLMVVVKGLYDNCRRKECQGEYQAEYDGWKLIARDGRGMELENLLDKTYLPQTFKLSLLDYLFVARRERYVSLATFSNDMEDMTKRLQTRCEKLTGTPEYDEKLTIYVYYFGSREPMIGYYDCGMKYVFFFSDFKVIRYANVSKRSSSYQSGEELKFTQDNHGESSNGGESSELIYKFGDTFDAEEENLRRKYSDYILRDLVYDQRERTFQSKSHFLSEVYAVRLLPSHDEEVNFRKGGYQFKIWRRARVVVYGQDAPKGAWMSHNVKRNS